MNHSNPSIFQSFLTSLSRGYSKRIQLAEVIYVFPAANFHDGADAFVPAELAGFSDGKSRMTRSHARISAFILRDLASSADDTFAS
jgi:hypothetical protein